MKLANAAQMRELDRVAIEEQKIPSIELMERAAGGVAQAALNFFSERPGKCRAAVFCGTGNNGGDGLAAARMLFLAGVRTRVFLVGSYEKLTPDAQEECRRLSECGVNLEPFDRENEAQRVWTLGSHVVIDAIFGVGLSRNIEENSIYAEAIQLMNQSEAPVIAVDIASGVAADTGKVLGCAVKAACTVTFTLAKIGQFVGDGALHSGEVMVWDIGIPGALTARMIPGDVWTVDQEYAAAVLPKRKADGHKGDFGKVLVVGGSAGYTGAPYLAASAAVHSGCGLVYLGVPENIWAIEAGKCVSAMPFALPAMSGKLKETAAVPIGEKMKACDVLALGPGLGRGIEVTRLVLNLLQDTEQPVILDADGINALEGHIDSLDERRGRVTILTPHDGEFAHIGGDLSSGDRVGAARDFAKAYGCILVLKGHRTVVAAPEGTVLVNTTGNSGLAKGGSGDVLTGLIASLLAQGCPAVQAAVLGVWLHGRAGDLAAVQLTPYCMTPENVILALPDVLTELIE